MALRTAAVKEIWIVDSGVVTAAGRDLEATWRGIVSGATAIAEIDRFPVQGYRSRMGACIPGMEKPKGSKSIIHTILDMLLAQIRRIPPDSFVITATTKAGIDNLEKIRRGIAADPEDILPSSIGDTVKKRLGLTGASINISAACASAAVATAKGAAAISSGITESVLVCCIDVMAEFIFSGFSALQNLSPFPCRPFDRDRAGLTPGEGAAFLLLLSRQRAERLGYFPLGTVAGAGIANDACHITAPDRTGAGLARAIRGAIRMSGVDIGEIAGVSAHGTGTIHNDLMELNAFRTIFGEKCPPVYSVKGCIGHTFGAAGGIEIALGMRSLLEGILPPTTGFSTPEEGAEGLVSAEPAPITGDCLLTVNSGFGGINSAIIIKKGVSP